MAPWNPLPTLRGLDAVSVLPLNYDHCFASGKRPRSVLECDSTLNIIINDAIFIVDIRRVLDSNRLHH